MTKNPFSDNCWQNSVSQYSIDTVAPATKRIAGFFLFPKLSVQSSMPFVLIIFSFISVFLCLQLIIISPKINIQSSFFFIYQCLTVMLVSFTMPANVWQLGEDGILTQIFNRSTKFKFNEEL